MGFDALRGDAVVLTGGQSSFSNHVVGGVPLQRPPRFAAGLAQSLLGGRTRGESFGCARFGGDGGLDLFELDAFVAQHLGVFELALQSR